MILVSACLLGLDCRYDGNGNKNEKLIEFLKGKDFIMICPEQLGGLSTPRKPCEISGERVISKDGDDFTKQFIKGYEEVKKIVELVSPKSAILKDGSPSCGSTLIYDGTFSGVKIPGKGFCAISLEEIGIKVFSENTFGDWREE